MKTTIIPAFKAVFAKGKFNPNQALIVFISLFAPVCLAFLVFTVTGSIHFDKF